jgi:hypothetical protein
VVKCRECGGAAVRIYRVRLTTSWYPVVTWKHYCSTCQRRWGRWQSVPPDLQYRWPRLAELIKTLQGGQYGHLIASEGER